MKKRICLYVDVRYPTRERATDFEQWMVNDEDYVILSEVVEVDFSMFPAEDVVPKQIEALEKKRTKETERHAAAIATIDELKSKLLAITHED